MPILKKELRFMGNTHYIARKAKLGLRVWSFTQSWPLSPAALYHHPEVISLQLHTEKARVPCYPLFWQNQPAVLSGHLDGL